jgi:CheY-like chemotaxis protein
MIAELGRSVLVVEDDREDRDWLASAFERAGYRVVAPRHSAEAFATLCGSTSYPSAVVVDWTMPILQGLDFLTAQAADPKLRQVRVIVLSDVGRMDRVPSEGIDAVLAKPVRMRTLIEVVNRLCGLPPRDAERTGTRRTQLRTRSGADPRRTPEVGVASTLQDTAAIRRPR